MKITVIYQLNNPELNVRVETGLGIGESQSKYFPVKQYTLYISIKWKLFSARQHLFALQYFNPLASSENKNNSRDNKIQCNLLLQILNRGTFSSGCWYSGSQFFWNYGLYDVSGYSYPEKLCDDSLWNFITKFHRSLERKFAMKFRFLTPGGFGKKPMFFQRLNLNIDYIIDFGNVT